MIECDECGEEFEEDEEAHFVDGEPICPDCFYAGDE